MLFIVIILYVAIFPGSRHSGFVNDEDRISSSVMHHLIYSIIMICAFNILWIMLSPVNYSAISYTVNSVGMICALLVIFDFAFMMVRYAPLFVIKKIIDKAIDKIKPKALDLIKSKIK